MTGPGGRSDSAAGPGGRSESGAGPAPGPASAGRDQASSDRERHAAGTAVRREVLGREHVDRAAAPTPFTADFQDLITRYAWGEIWSRPGLDRRTRSCVTLGVLAALGCTEELDLHVRAALRNGLSPDEIREVLLHTAVYAGVPRANTAFAVAGRALDHGPGDADAGRGDADHGPGDADAGRGEQPEA
ncbi:MAG: 4-carboxymuconolactone decarboxylase [Acidimicrobiales bacterium]